MSMHRSSLQSCLVQLAHTRLCVCVHASLLTAELLSPACPYEAMRVSMHRSSLQSCLVQLAHTRLCVCVHASLLTAELLSPACPYEAMRVCPCIAPPCRLLSLACPYEAMRVSMHHSSLQSCVVQLSHTRLCVCVHASLLTADCLVQLAHTRLCVCVHASLLTAELLSPACPYEAMRVCPCIAPHYRVA